MSEKIDREPARRMRQAGLSFSGDRAVDVFASSSPAGQVAESAAGRAVVPCLDADDLDADLEAMTNEDLRRHVDELKTSPDRRHDVVLRLLKGIAVLDHRGLLRPRGARRAPVDVPAFRPERSRASARRRLAALLRRVHEGGSLAAAESLAEFLAVDLVDSGMIPKFRMIARGVRERLVDPRTVRAAYKAAKKPGVNNSGALLWWFVAGRSPGLARVHAMRRYARPGRRRRH